MPLDDEDEEGENEEGKPKKKKPKKDSIGSKSKKQDPNAPPQNRWGKKPQEHMWKCKTML